MSQQQEPFSSDPAQPEDNDAPAAQQQQQEQPAASGHGGQGSDSAMKQLRVWEQQRAVGHKHRTGGR